MTLDGRGERATTAYHVGRGHALTSVGQVTMPHSLGLLYEQITSYLGFLHSSDDKVMALALYGKPRYVADFREIVRLMRAGMRSTLVIPASGSARPVPARERSTDQTLRHRPIAASRARRNGARTGPVGCTRGPPRQTCAWPGAWRSTAS